MAVRTAMKGQASFERSISLSAASSTLRAFGPATAMPAHCSVTEVTATFRSGHTADSRNSRWVSTPAALAVVVVIRNRVSPSRQVVPSS